MKTKFFRIFAIGCFGLSLHFSLALAQGYQSDDVNGTDFRTCVNADPATFCGEGACTGTQLCQVKTVAGTDTCACQLPPPLTAQPIQLTPIEEYPVEAEE
jgi:hypothetical protein